MVVHRLSIIKIEFVLLKILKYILKWTGYAYAKELANVLHTKFITNVKQQLCKILTVSEK